MNIDKSNTSVFTNHNKTFVGIANKQWFNSGNIQDLLFCMTTSIPVVIKNLERVTSNDELDLIIKNIDAGIKNIQDEITENKNKIGEFQEYIEKLKTIKVVESDLTVVDLILQIEGETKGLTEEEICWPSFDCTKVLKGIVQFPRGTEPYFYNTYDDLLQFKVGDKVEVQFGKKYKNKKRIYVVNNVRPYEWRNKSQKLALTPAEDNWSREDILFIDDTDRFECLMIDLFEENRKPFRGWRSKAVQIKKIGTVGILPIPETNDLTLEDLQTITDDEYVFLNRFQYGVGFEIIGMAKGPHSNCCKIYSTADVKWGLESFNKCIAALEKEIKNYERSLDDQKLLKTGAQQIKELNLF